MHSADISFEQLLKTDAGTLCQQGLHWRDSDEHAQDYAKAIRYLSLAALEDHVQAQYELGLMNLRGEGVEKNRLRALMWFWLAGGLNDPRATSQSNQLARQLSVNDVKRAQHQVQHFYQAQKLFRKARAATDLQAITALGVMLAAGQGVEQDNEQAVYWFRLASRRQYAEAECHLAACYASGKGIDKNLHEAIRLYQRAAAQGNPDAHYHLADMIERGAGHAADAGKAIKHYQTAAVHGQVQAQLRLGFLFHSTNRRDAELLAKSHHYFSKAAEQGNAEAQCQLGLLYAQGLGVTQDFEQAAEWYQRAAAKMHPKAQFNLAFLCAHGEGVEQDYIQAYMWYRLSTLYGYAQAQINLEFIAKKMTEAEIEKALWKADHFFNSHTANVVAG